ncbi:hypothetical protein [Gordonia sp. (in: high G+C Gram-positive bacteria)]|uniref:hypothetical protein n=1 Tax=Gordonia sp. (in: high G+C Gram-positive bacteria) TaxID=84139 RepID=UPI00333FDF61
MTDTQLDIFNALSDAVDAVERRRRLADHAAGRHCAACGTTEWPHSPVGVA